MTKTLKPNIAITGIACRLPQAKDPQQFWQTLSTGASAAGPIPADRWNGDTLYDPRPNTAGKAISKWGCFLDDVWGFDAPFFDLSEEEATFIDPQHRLLLELAYEAIADSGHTADFLRGKRVGVFIGISQSPYEAAVRDHLFSDQISPPTVLANNLRNLAAGRIADALNLKGPTFAIDSACSSALLALHYARLSLQTGECDYALVGGVNLNLNPTPFLAFSNAGALSPTAESYLFDQRSCGIVLGEGGGMAFLTKSSTAEAEHTPVLALLAGSAVNNDGRSHGPMTPNTAGQQQVMTAAYHAAGIDPAALDYVEAHGTGTPIGDLVEARSLNRFFSHLAEEKPRPRYVGSVKPNVGHLLSGAGMASLIKVILALRHEQIPPSRNCDQPHPRLRFGEVGLTVNAKAVPWPLSSSKPRLAGINGFGFGGTNVHIILQDALNQPDRRPLPAPVFQRKPLRVPAIATGLAHVGAPPKIDPWLHTVVWEPAPLPPLAKIETRPTVVLAEDGETGQAVATKLQNQGADGRFCPLETVAKQTGRFRLLILAQSLSYLRTVAQQLAAESLDQIESIVIGTAACDPLGTLNLGSKDALLASFAFALNDELHRPVQAINTDKQLADGPWFAELIRPTVADQILWRSGERFVRKVVPIPADTARKDSPLSSDGVYLITGGGSGVGGAIAKGLALDVAPTLVLVGRTRLADGLGRADLLSKLRWAEATADYIAADVTHLSQVEQLISDVLAKHGRIDGVIHAAGVVDGGRLSGRSDADHERVLAPKVSGTQHLFKTLKKHGVQPDFFVGFSSISAVLPGFSGGLSDYAAANGYLDGFAHEHGVRSFNWTIWTESGQGAQSAIVDNLERSGLHGVSDKEGYRLFKSALRLPQTQVVIVNREAVSGKRRPLPPPESPSVKPTNPVKSARPTEDAGPTVTILTRLLADELEIEPEQVPLDRSFANMGLDSMGAMELVAQLEDEGFGRLPATLFFEHNTITKLAVYLENGGAFAEQSSAASEPSAPESTTQAERFPLTPLQRSLLSQQINRPQSCAYAYLRLTVRGAFDLAKAGKAFEQLFVRHGQLRARFSLDPGGDGALQEIVPFGRLDRRPQVEAIRINQPIEAFEDDLVNRPMPLLGSDTDQLARLLVVQEDGQTGEQHLLFLLHHIIADGWSLSVLVQEFWHSYFGGQVEPPATRFADYAERLQAEQAGAIHQENIDWWRSYLADASGPSDLERGGGRHAVHRFKIGREQTQQLKNQARGLHATLFHWLLAAQAKALAEWQGSADLTLGVAEARRDYNLPQIERLVGSLADIFPLRLTVDVAQPLAALVESVKAAWLEAHQHTHISSAQIRSLGANQPTAAFSFSHFPRFVAEDGPLALTGILGRTGTAQTRLSLVCWTLADELYFTWNYRDDLFSAAEVEALSKRFLAVLGESADSESVPPFLTKIGHQLQHSAGQIAVLGPETTFQTLSDGVSRVLSQMRAQGFEPGDVVAFPGEPGLPALCALLATFWGGGTWLPLDPAAPKPRLAHSLRVAQAGFLLGELGQNVELPSGCRPIEVDHSGPAEPLPNPLKRGVNAIAYIIFTSGSTGEPKGVPIRYDSLDRYLDWAVGTLGYAADDVAMWGTSLSFDASLRQCLAPLMSGGRLWPVGRNTLLNPPKLAAELVTNRVSVWSSVPTLWGQMLSFWEQAREQLPADLRQVQLGGEALKASLVQRWVDLISADDGSNADPEFANLYGPTENTINATAHIFRPSAFLKSGQKSVPIGRPLTDVVVNVVDQSGKVCAAGERGELLIGGRLLSPGYLQAGRFKPLASRDGGFFRSGDLVEVLADGGVRYVGRLDNQVKVRGHRVELEEIEHAFLGEDGVEQVVVSLRKDENSADLVAHVVADRPGLDAQALRNAIAQKLPSYMVPQRIEFADAIPLLPNGKIDRSALDKRPTAAKPIVQVVQNKSFSDTEARLATLWRKLLNVDAIAPDDDFFALGGDSLNIMELMILLKNEGIVVERAADLIENRTLRGQANVLNGQSANGDFSLPAADDGPFPLSPAQVGFWMARSLSAEGSTTWHAAFWLDGELNREKFSEAVQVLVARHPLLRTVCVADRRPPLQQTIVPGRPLAVTFEAADLDPNLPLEDQIDAVAQRFREAHTEPFDLATWPLMRLHLVRFAADQHLWLVAGDHFIGDGMSGAVFGRELFAVYDDLVANRPVALAPLRSTFREYVNLAVEKEKRLAEKAAVFWGEMFGRPYVAKTGWHRPANGRSDSEMWLSHTLEFDPNMLKKMRQTAAKLKLTLHDFLLAIFYQQLAELTGEADLIVGTAVAGRDYPLADLLGIFGSFATILPLRLDFPAGSENETDASIKQIGSVLEQGRIHHCSPRQISRLADASLSLTDLTSTQFLFSLMDFGSMGSLQSDTLTVDWDRSRSDIAPPNDSTDLMLSGRTLDGRLRLTFTAGNHALDQSRLDRFAKMFEQQITHLTKNQVDSALIGYLPGRAEVVRQVTKLGLSLTADQARSLIFADENPRFFESLACDLGRSGTVTLPYFADELAAVPTAELCANIVSAVALASEQGAWSIALAGMLPSLTDYGFALAHLLPQNEVELTTGHSVTVVAVVRNGAHGIKKLRLNPSEISLGFLGLGSIGSAALKLYLRHNPHPAELVLCDVAASQKRLERLEQTLRNQIGFKKKISIAFGGKQAPAELYTADVIVGAASQPDLIQVAQLRPGTLVIDDSFPPCFDQAQGIKRMTAERDVLLCGGGLLDIGPVERAFEIPDSLAKYGDHLLAQFPSAGVASCQLEAILRASRPELPLTSGLVDEETVELYWQAIEDLGFIAAPLHLGTFMIDDRLVEAVGSWG